MADYIVAIDLGTSHLTGIVGEKKADGTFSIVACETVDTDSCIRRGIIYNRDNTATHVGNLLRRLERSLNGLFIDKVYIGVGGQSLRTINHVETRDIAEGAAVTEEDIDFLKEQCRKFKPDNLLDVLAVAPAVYYVDGRKDTNPVGVTCRRFEAHYKIVIGRPSIRSDIEISIKQQLSKEVVEILVSPLTLADAMLSHEDKELGCALVDFGAGVTSISVFQDGNLVHICVIPFGGKLITKDIATMQLTEANAEKLKKEHGSVNLQKTDENTSIPIQMEGVTREIKLSDLNAIIEGRTKELVENVYARISEVIELQRLGAGIVLAGCAAELNGLPELLADKCNKVKVRNSMIRKDLVKDTNNMLGNPLYMTAISLMLKGTVSCVPKSQVKTSNPPVKEDTVDKSNPPVKEDDKGSGVIKPKKDKWYDRLFSET